MNMMDAVATAASSRQTEETRAPDDAVDDDHPHLTGLVFQVGQVYRQAMGKRLKQERWLADVGFRPPCIGAIMTVARHQPLSQREVSSKLGVDPSDLVNVIDILERAGFVSRQRDPADRRRHLLTLTPEGESAVRRLRALLDEVDDEVLSPLSAGQRHLLHRLLQGVAAHHL